MRKFADQALFGVLYSLFWLGSLQPLWLLYLQSDLLAWLLGDVVGYRKKVIDTNLRNSFPKKSKKELKAIRRGYYRFLADYFVETLKLTTMSRAQLTRRMTFENIEAVNAHTRQGRSVTLYLGHYCNWEWASSLSQLVETDGFQVYHPLKSVAVNKLFLKIRDRYGAESVPMNEIMRTLLGRYRDGIPTVTGYLADQKPISQAIHCWTEFLSQETGVFTGAERISRKIRAAAFYVRIWRPRRGYYHARFEEICPDVAATEVDSVTKQYFKMLEEDIHRKPDYWLWSHRRWKISRWQWEEIYGPEAARRLQKP